MYFYRIAQLRREAGLKQADVYRMLGIPQAQYSRYERGERDLPLRYLIGLAKFYGVSADYILELTDERIPLREK